MSWAITLGCFGLGELQFRLIGHMDSMVQDVIVACLVIGAPLAPFAALVIFALSYRDSAQLVSVTKFNLAWLGLT
jgi:hypothetical protein